MQFTKLNPETHDLDKVSELIYYTDIELSKLLYGKNKPKALSKIKRIVKIGGNSLGYENIHLALEKDNIIGLTVAYKTEDVDPKVESERFSKALNFLSLFRIFFFEKIILNRLLTIKHNLDDLYISNVCVDVNYRGKGVGKFLLENIIYYAKYRNCSKIVLDVTQKNKIAFSLYEKMGFEIVDSKSMFFGRIRVFKMKRKI